MPDCFCLQPVQTRICSHSRDRNHPIGCCITVVTREGKFQRTKHANAIIKILEFEELIAKSEQEYV